ncbi:sugar ABC transporter ATP-binding protein [uncultured Sphaerochaeta sp.]|uniref:sugar ABC transporter ATP-binding protein n=1 Tax=uncultured Sphaerochaeta sp. TaxID=886478 RepID=UPI002A0A32BA|nr:sugar ABC transporter ATP-binding protein [uncultured Sphaerochaeta sp.]
MEEKNETEILSLTNITKRYPGVLALDDVSIDVYHGEVLALVGENGAGKSTLIKVITGAISPDEGNIRFDGKDYTGLNPILSQEIGIAAIYQEFTMAPALSVAENIFLGQRLNKGILLNRKLLNKRATEILDTLHVSIDPNEMVKNLSVANTQLIEIAKVLAKNPKFIIMDEPTAPLTGNEVDILMEIVHELKRKGITIVYISHRLDEVFKVADRVVILRDGKMVTSKSVGEVNKDQLIYYMVGRKLSESFPKRELHYGETLLEVKNLSGPKNFPISFSLKKGEILGIGGLVGAGRTELSRLIFGADKKISGEIFINGRKVEINSPQDAVSAGIGLVSEDRKNLGVLLRMSIGNNITLPILKTISNGLILDSVKESKIVEEQVKGLSIATPSVQQLAGKLSGGNQQKVALGKWLASDARILILDEPTRGIDVGNKNEIYKLMYALVKKGMAIIVISSEMEEILGLTDRMLVLCEGKLMGELKKEDYSQENVLYYASGERPQDLRR